MGVQFSSCSPDKNILKQGMKVMDRDRYTSWGVKSVIGSATGCNPVPFGSVGSNPTRPTISERESA